MATAELVILSSSPHDIPKRHIYSVHSSPSRDGPLFQQPRKHILKSGSRAGEVPHGASFGFCTASTLIKDHGFDLETELVAEQNLGDVTELETRTDPDAGSSEPAKAKKQTKREKRSKLKTDNTLELRDEKEDDCEISKADANLKKLRREKDESKRRAIPDTSKTLQQMPQATGEVTKPSVLMFVAGSNDFQYPPGLNLTDHVSSHFNTNGHKASLKSRGTHLSDHTQDDIPLSRANDGSESGKENLSIMSSAEIILENDPGRLSKEVPLNDESIAQGKPAAAVVDNSAPFSVRAEERQSVTKRRNIHPSNSVSPTKKVKQPSKSSRTITGFALAPFRIPLETGEPSAPAVNDFPAPPVLLPEQKTETAKTAKKRSRSPKKAQEGTKSKSSKSRPPEVPKLLSPGAARKKMKKQDVLFCTSSQLVRDESPAFIRDLQQAMRLSDTESSLPNETAGTINDITLAPDDRLVRSNRDLWLSANRSANGDMVDLYHPEPFEPTMPAASSDFIDIDAVGVSSPPNPAVTCRALPSSSPPLVATMPELRPEMSKLKLASAQQTRPKSTLMCAMDEIGTTRERSPEHIRRASTIISPVGQDTSGNPQHQEEKNSRARSAKKSTKKAKDKHETMVPKKPRGRPRKNPEEPPKTPKKRPKTKDKKSEGLPNAEAVMNSHTADDFIAIDDISDFEPCTTPSPPRRKGPTITQELELSPEAPIEAPKGKKSSAIPHIPTKVYQDELFPHLKSHLFKRITAAVKSVPRTRDPQTPTWHEKILLYDPIVLEDLTDWLNAGPLQDAGFTGFSAYITLPVKKKDGNDEEGQNIYKFEQQEKEVTVKPGEVDPWMVQKWCQDKSICCLWRGGLWGSVRLAY